MEENDPAVTGAQTCSCDVVGCRKAMLLFACRTRRSCPDLQNPSLSSHDTPEEGEGEEEEESGSGEEEEDECVTWCSALTVVHYVAPIENIAGEKPHLIAVIVFYLLSLKKKLLLIKVASCSCRDPEVENTLSVQHRGGSSSGGRDWNIQILTNHIIRFSLYFYTSGDFDLMSALEESPGIKTTRVDRLRTRNINVKSEGSLFCSCQQVLLEAVCCFVSLTNFKTWSALI